MMSKVIGWVVEHRIGDSIDTRYVRDTEEEATTLLEEMKANDLSPEVGEWSKAPIYSVV